MINFNKLRGLSIGLICLLNAGCNNNKTDMTKNPLLYEFNTPHNSVPFNKIKPEHFKPAFDSVFASTMHTIKKIIENKETPDFKNTIIALEHSSNLLGRLSNILFNLNVAETNKEVQQVTREISPLLSDFRNDILLNEVLFEKIKLIKEKTDINTLDQEDRMLLKNTYEKFVRNGANLSDSNKQRYREITNKLAKLTVDFGENVLAETNNYFLNITNIEDLSGLPEDLIAEAHEEAIRRGVEGWVITLQFPSFVPFLKNANNRELRKEVLLAHSTRCLNNNKYNNTKLIQEITALRMELANLLGFNTYADFILSNRMAESTDNVKLFLSDLLMAAKPYAIKELKEIEQYAKKLGAKHNIEIWDWSYYAEKLKKEKYDINDEITRPYFKLENVEKGVFGLANTLYGLNFKEVQNVPVYHTDVKVFEVFDEKNEFLALLYMDYFPRESKKGGAWMTEYLQQCISPEGQEVRPHVSLVFNFTKPTKSKPSLLTYNEVTTLLHEFGHGLHGIFSQCKYKSISGTNVYRDFVELPSQLLENWAEQKEWLDKVAIHYKTGKNIPNELVNKLINARNFNSGYHCIRQLSFSITDMKWHTIKEPYNSDIATFEKEAMLSTQLLPKIDGTAMSASFNHIFSGGYAAGYYSYKWAEVLDADAFAVFKEKGIYNKEIAEKFRDNILSKGGTEHPMDLYVKFRGHEPSIEPLLERSGLNSVKPKTEEHANK